MSTKSPRVRPNYRQRLGRCTRCRRPVRLKMRLARAVQKLICRPATQRRCGGTGRRDGLKIRWWQHHGGSSPSTGTADSPCPSAGRRPQHLGLGGNTMGGSSPSTGTADSPCPSAGRRPQHLGLGGNTMGGRALHRHCRLALSVSGAPSRARTTYCSNKAKPAVDDVIVDVVPVALRGRGPRLPPRQPPPRRPLRRVRPARGRLATTEVDHAWLCLVARETVPPGSCRQRQETPWFERAIDPRGRRGRRWALSSLWSFAKSHYQATLRPLHIRLAPRRPRDRICGRFWRPAVQFRVSGRPCSCSHSLFDQPPRRLGKKS